MALVVEDGTGLSNANSYISVADAETYHTDRGNSDWTGAQAADKEAALIKATQWLDGRYRRRWIGIRYSSGQALEWPRTGAVDPDGYVVTGVPGRIAQAAAEAALLVIQGEALNPVLERGGRVKREKTGPIETEFTDNAPAQTTFTVVSDLVGGYIGGPGLRITL